MEVARTYVQDLGGGLIMLGGDQSFGLGGYYKTTLEEILPVRSDFEKEKEKPSLAMMLVIDKSGSMGGEKIEMAKEAARAAVELLGPSDKVGVLAFEGENFWVSELHPCTDKGFVLDRIAGLEAGGGTVMAPAMEEAYETLQDRRGQAQARDHPDRRDLGARRLRGDRPGDGRRPDHGLDGRDGRRRRPEPARGDRPDRQRPVLRRRRPRPGAADLRQGDGHGQQVGDQRAAVLARRWSGPTQVLSEIRLDEAPFLLGYVVTRPKPTAEVILATESGDPLLAWWRYGLGMSVAFTSDAKARWAAEWLTWPQFGQFWAQVVRHCAAQGRGQGARWCRSSARAQGRRSRSTPSSPSGKFLNRAATELTLVDPRLGDARRSRWPRSRRGDTRPSSTRPGQGSYQLMFSQTKDSQLVGRQTRGLAVGYPDELRLRPTNTGAAQVDRRGDRRPVRRDRPSRCSRRPSAPRRGPCRSGRTWRRPRRSCSCSMWRCAASI